MTTPELVERLPELYTHRKHTLTHSHAFTFVFTQIHILRPRVSSGGLPNFAYLYTLRICCS